MQKSIYFLPAFLALYLAASRLALRGLGGVLREATLALLNLAAVYIVFFMPTAAGLSRPRNSCSM